MVNVRESAEPAATVAASQLASPDCDAVIVQFPFDTMCTIAPLTVHTDVGLALNDTVNVEVALVVTAKSLSPYVLAEMLFSDRVCAALSMVMVTGDEERARWFVPTAFVAVTAHDPAPSTVRVVPVMVQGSPFATAYVTAPSPEPPDVDSDTVVLFGAGAYVTVVLAGIAVSTACAALLIVRVPATYVMA